MELDLVPLLAHFRTRYFLVNFNINALLELESTSSNQLNWQQQQHRHQQQVSSKQLEPKHKKQRQRLNWQDEITTPCRADKWRLLTIGQCSLESIQKMRNPFKRGDH